MTSKRLASVFGLSSKTEKKHSASLAKTMGRLLLPTLSVLLPSTASADMTIKNWWGADNVKVAPANDCGSIFAISGSCQNDGQFELNLDGVNVNGSNTVFADDVTGYTWQVGDGVSAVKNVSGSTATVKLYFIKGAEKDTLTFSLPTYPMIGIKGENYKDIDLADVPSFSVSNCSVNEIPSDATFQWQKLLNGETVWADVTGETGLTFTPAAGGPDSISYRVVMTLASGDVNTAPIMVTYALPKFEFEINGTIPFPTVQKPLYEHEIYNEDTFNVKVNKVYCLGTPTYNILTRTDNDQTFTLLKSSNSPEFELAPVQNMEYLIQVAGKDLRPGHEGEDVEVSDTFFVRVRHIWVNAARIDTLFSDNFGSFQDDDTYTTFDGNKFTGELTDVNGDTYPVKSGWAPDYFNSIRNHEYVTNDPLVGPFNGDCGADGYAHYSCWNYATGACDGNRVENGYYAIYSNPNYSNCQHSGDYWNGTDHTNQPGVRGGMLFVNVADNSLRKVVFERTFTLDSDCENTMLLLTAYVNNATAKVENSPVNVRMVVKDATDTEIYSVASGNIFPRGENGGNWANLSYKFVAAKGGKYTIQLQNNIDGVNGNDLLFDDISITVVYPDLQVYRNREKTDVSPIDTCAEVDVPLYMMSKYDIKTFIDFPLYMYQTSKDSVNWTTITDIVNIDSVVVKLRKDDPKSWGKTFYRGVVAADTATLELVKEGVYPAVSCNHVYSISEGFPVNFNYSGPLSISATKETLCVGDTTVIKAVHGRDKYRWVDLKGNTILNQDSIISYVPTEDAPADSVFTFVSEERLGCTDTIRISIHRQLYTKFETPDLFQVCLFDSVASLTDLRPTTGATYEWKLNGTVDPSSTSAQYTIPAVAITPGSQYKGVITVTASAPDFCPTTKSFDFDVHDTVGVALAADRDDSLFCLSASDLTFKLTAKTTAGAPAKYTWTYDGAEVATTDAPTNFYAYANLTEGKHTFGVKVSDGVCNVSGQSDFKIALPTEVREPISIALESDAPVVCVNDSIHLKVTLKHLLTNPTDVSWNASNNAKVEKTATKTNASSESTNAAVAVSSSNEKEDVTIIAKVTDNVCKQNVPEAKVVVNVHKFIKLSLEAERSDSLFCLSSAETKFHLVAKTDSGNPEKYVWTLDGAAVATTTAPINYYDFASLSEGSHQFGVMSSDAICNLEGTSDFVANLPVEVREPITLSLSSVDKACADENVVVNLTANHLLADPTEVNWNASNNAKLASITTTTASAASSNSFDPVSSSNEKETVTVVATITDKVCKDNQPKDTKLIDIYKKIKVHLVTDRDDSLFCLGSSDAKLTMTAVVDSGNPSVYKWTYNGVAVESTNAPLNTYSFANLEEGVHAFGVMVVDGVCNKADLSDFITYTPINVREPISMELLADRSRICEDSLVNLVANFKHLLEEPTMVAWTVNAAGKLSATSTGTEKSTTSNIVAPVSSNNKTEKIEISASVDDKVCPQNSPLKKTVNVDLHKKLNIELVANGVDSLHCLKTTADALIELTANVKSGEPKLFIWNDGKTTSTNSRPYTLALGSNHISVKAVDSVCSSDADEANSEVSIRTRQPLSVSLAQVVGSNPTCIGETVKFEPTVGNVFPGDKIKYTWTPSSLSGTGVVSLTPGVGSTNVSLTVEEEGNAVCPAQTDSRSITVQDSVRIAIKVPESLCQTPDTSEVVELKTYILNGNPQFLVWSTGDTTKVTADSISVFYNPASTMTFSVFAIDKVCANSNVITSKPVAVSNLFDIEITPESIEVQMGEDAQFTVTTIDLPYTYTGKYTWITNMVQTGESTGEKYKQNLHDDGTYTFYAQADGGYCGTITSNKVDIFVADYYNIPTAFTPYNDNPKNNVFLKGYHVQIFNRYQQSVFEGYDGWNGEYNGKLADPGTYFYRLWKKDGRMIKGTIELVKF